VNWKSVEVGFGILLLVGSLIGWPLTALTVAKDEPQFILALSWLAIRRRSDPLRAVRG
jgi:hypothetical protein